MNRRVQARAIAPMLGVTARTVVALASQGRLPTAAKIGHVWTFDLKAIEAFIARQEQQTRDAAWPKKTSTGEEPFGGFARQSEAFRSEKAFTRGISKLLGSSETKGSRR